MRVPSLLLMFVTITALASVPVSADAPRAHFVPASDPWTFRPLAPDYVRDESLDVNNDGDAEGKAFDPEIVGPDASSFQITHSLGLIGAGSTDVVTVRFKPGTLGTKSAQLVTDYDVDTGDGGIGSPDEQLVIELRGNAVDVPPGLVSDPAEVDLGTHPQKSHISTTLHITNVSDGPIHTGFVDTEYLSSFSLDLTYNSCDVATLAAGHGCTIIVEAYLYGVGEQDAAVIVPSDDPHSELRVDLHVLSTEVDTVAPRMKRLDEPVPTRAYRASDHAVRIALAWHGTDRYHEVVGYQAQWRRAGGAWATLVDQRAPFAAAAKENATVKVPTGDIEVRVRGRDPSNNVSSWLTRTSRIAYRDLKAGNTTLAGRWSTLGARGKAYGDSLLASGRNGDSATVRLYGSTYALVARRTPTSGRVKVYVNGGLYETADLYAASRTDLAVVASISFSDARTRELKVVVQQRAGDRDDAAIDAWVVVR